MREQVMALKDMDIAIVGAGIGGLAAAVALRQAGAQVTVLEQASELSEIGAGLQISANGMVVLRALGVVSPDTGGPGLRSDGTIIRDYRTGRRVTVMPPPLAGPTYYFHRADLVSLLQRAAESAGVRFLLGNRVLSHETAAGKSSLCTDTGQVLRPDLVIAADGGRSLLRKALNGRETPVFSRQVAWRATVRAPGHDMDNRAVLTMAPGRHVVTYPLRGGNLVNIVAIEERTDWRQEGWRIKGDPAELKRRFTDFGGPAAALLSAVENVHQWALFLRPVASRWQNGALALVGDAAHPTLPFMAQGACLALEDAWVLAQSLSNTDDVAAALINYENARKDRARLVVAAAAANARNFHHKSPMRDVVKLGLWAFGPRIAQRYDWIYEHDVTDGRRG